MSIVCLGDLVLDVIVRLEQPLAAGADATSRIVLRPGGQAANVAAWIAALGGSPRFSASAATTTRALSPRRPSATIGSRSQGRQSRTATASSSRSSIPAGERTMCPDRGVAASSARRRSTRRGSRTRAPPRLGVRPAPRSGQVRGDPGDRARARARRAGQHRPLVLERDPRLRRRAVPRPARRARARRRLRERGGGRIVGGPLAGCTWILKLGAAGARSTGSNALRHASRGRRLDRGGRRLRGRLARRRA